MARRVRDLASFSKCALCVSPARAPASSRDEHRRSSSPSALRARDASTALSERRSVRSLLLVAAGRRRSVRSGDRVRRERSRSPNLPGARSDRRRRAPCHGGEGARGARTGRVASGVMSEVAGCHALRRACPIWGSLRGAARGTRPALDSRMNNLLRGGLAGAGAWWLGGGLFSTLIIFGLIWWFLGHFH